MNNLLIKLIVLSVFILTQFNHKSYAATNPTVTTKSGKIEGKVLTLDDTKTEVYLYKGIPYAQPPTGVLRFRKPLPVTKWEGTYAANKTRYSCPQSKGGIDKQEESEDCLLLSIWQPNKPLTNGTKRSVMVFIHGGMYKSGSIFTFYYDGKYLAALGDVVVVAMNYRLGPFGFLYAGTEEAPGNIGLHDQILALTWVKDNIEAFDGNPNSITIVGGSAGSMSVGALLSSPLTKGLFKRAIMQSGSPDSLTGSDNKENSLEKFNQLAKAIHCNQTVVNDVIQCLRNKTILEILESSSTSLQNPTAIFNPVIGDQLLPIKPYEALKSGNQDIDLMFGTVNDEGFLFLTEVFHELSPEKNTDMSVDKAKQIIQLIGLILGQNYSESVANFYTKGLKDTQKTELLRAISDSVGDYVITCPAILYGSQFLASNKSHKAYAYRLTHAPPIHVSKACQGWTGVCHGEDVLFLLGIPIALRGIAFTEDDYTLSKDMINVWSTFAKTGTPSALNGTKWPEALDRSIANPSVKYMELNPINYRIVENGYKANCEEFWKPHLT